MGICKHCLKSATLFLFAGYTVTSATMPPRRNEVNELREEIESLRSMIQDLVTNRQNNTGSSSSSYNSGHSYNNPEREQFLRQNAPKKVHLEALPRFDGSILEWPHFQSIMEMNVIYNDHLTATSKITYLASTTRSSAQMLVKQLIAKNSSIDDIWTRLKEKFEDKNKAQDELKREARTFPKIKSKLDSGNIRTGLDKALWFEAVLENTPQLIEGIQRTLLGDIANSAFADLKWKINAKCQTFADLVKLLQKMLSAAESNTSTSNESSENNKRPKGMVNKITELICSFDGEAHLHKDCPLTVQERATIAKQKNLCVCCLKPGHSSNSCFRKRNCYVCQIPHNRALCPRPKNEPSSTEVKQAHQCNHVSETKTCFKTLIAKCEQKPVRCFFDEGSNCNFISSAAVQRLKLKTVNAKTKTFNTFGTTQPSFTATKFCKFSLNNCVTIEAIVVPSFGIQSYGAPDQDTVNLANSHGFYPNDDHTKPVEVLIGVHSARKILNQTLNIGDFTFQHSTIGDLCYGGHCPSLDSSLVNSILKTLNETENLDETDNYTEEFISKQVTEQDGRIKVKLPWIPPVNLDTNYELCKQRLLSNMKRLKRLNLYQDYQTIIDEYLTLGIITPTTIKFSNEHFLNHHAVIREDKTTSKIRIVFDGSCKGKNGKSLNHFLYKGNVEWNMIEVLLRFRAGRYAMAADITKAFLMISVDESDQEFLKFLWLDKDSKIIAYKFQRVPFGTSASPFLLFSALKKISLDHPNFATLLPHFYVDDFLYSSDNKEDILATFKACADTLTKYGFTLSKLQTNTNTQATDPITSILGLNWDRTNDTISIKPTESCEYSNARQLSSLIARHYDIFGFINPYLMELRRLLSLGWKQASSWDEPFPASIVKSVDNVIQQMKNITPINRCVNSRNSNLVIFTDANAHTIACVFYLVSHSHSHLIFSKALLKTSKTIPLAELNAITLGCKFLPHFVELFQPTRTILFSDSKINLDRICIDNVNRLKHPLAMRILNIREVFNQHSVCISHISSEENMADHLTKLKKFNFSNWLSPAIELEQNSYFVCSIKESDPPALTETDADEIINHISKAKSLADLTPLKHSLETMIIATQFYYWQDDYSKLINNKIPGKQSDLYKYRCFSTNGLVYVHLRSSIEDYRIWLPRQSHIVRLIMKHIHENLSKHTGYMDLYFRFCLTYFAEGAKKMAYNLIAQCQQCANLRKPQVKFPPGILPSERLAIPAHAFSRISMDFAGPLITDEVRHYVLVIRCFNSGAVFLKLLQDQTSKSVLLTIQQLSAHYSTPNFIYTDNASSFVKTKKWIRLINQEITDLSLQGKVTWKFSVAHSPQTNGITERMVGYVKKLLRNYTFKKDSTKLELETFLAEVSTLINSRPLFNSPEGIITPFHLIVGHQVQTFPLQRTSASNSNDSTLIQYSLLKKKINSFWHLWKDYYFIELRETRLKSSTPNDIQLYDTVLLEYQPGLPRHDWLVGKIVKLHHGPDSIARTADVKLSNGKLLLRRSLQRIVLIPAGEDVTTLV